MLVPVTCSFVLELKERRSKKCTARKVSGGGMFHLTATAEECWAKDDKKGNGKGLDRCSLNEPIFGQWLHSYLLHTIKLKFSLSSNAKLGLGRQ